MNLQIADDLSINLKITQEVIFSMALCRKATWLTVQKGANGLRLAIDVLHSILSVKMIFSVIFD